MKHEGRKEFESRFRDIIDRVLGTIMDESHDKILTNNFFLLILFRVKSWHNDFNIYSSILIQNVK